MRIADNARAQHNGLFRSMSLGGTWHLYRAPGTDNVALLRYDSRSGATCAFVSEWDDAAHGELSRVNDL